MRLIDADTLIEVFRYSNICRLSLKEIIAIIKDAHTITIKEWVEEMPIYIKDAMLDALRPKGKWMSNYTSQFRNPGRQCSLCGKIVEFSENFCPKCGADMRGEENE